MPSAPIPLLVAGMLTTGISNSLLNKYQDMQCVERCDTRHPVTFEQPVWQTLQMFVGECLCLVPVLWAWHARRRSNTKNGGYQSLPRSQGEAEAEAAVAQESERRGGSSASSPSASPFLFFLPAFCDICGTTLMNVGLLFTPVSIYQMTRGALVLWVGVFSVVFLRRHLHLYQWLMLVTVMLGVSIVGMSGTILKDIDVDVGAADVGDGPQIGDVPPAVTALLGVVIILFAQLFTAAQFVLEEKIMARHHVDPLLAVGYEGIFGLSTVLLAMPILHLLIGRTPSGRGGYFDVVTGYRQMVSSPTILWTSVAIALSIAFFNGCGLAVTRAISATARSTIDTCRTLGIWVASLTLGWEVFKPLSGSLQSVGFALLVYGTLVFNGIVAPPAAIAPRVTDSGGRENDDTHVPPTPTQVQAAQTPLVDVDEGDARRRD